MCKCECLGVCVRESERHCVSDQSMSAWWEWEREGKSVCVCAGVWLRVMIVCVRAWVRVLERKWKSLCECVCMHAFLCLLVVKSVCVGVCVRERESLCMRERKTERERGKKCVWESKVFEWMCAHAFVCIGIMRVKVWKIIKLAANFILFLFFLSRSESSFCQFCVTFGKSFPTFTRPSPRSRATNHPWQLRHPGTLRRFSSTKRWSIAPQGKKWLTKRYFFVVKVFWWSFSHTITSTFNEQLLSQCGLKVWH